MTKPVIDELRDKHGLTKNDAEMAFEQVVGAMKSVIDREKRVSIRGWGTFKKKMREARQGRNPMTGETITIAAREVTTFAEAKA